MKQGPDLSHHQRISDWSAVAANVDFMLHKATEGATFTDSVFATRWRRLGELGIPRGAYHFARPGGSSVELQAQHFVGVCRAAGWRSGDVWALDLEDAGGQSAATLVRWATDWAQMVRRMLGGPGLFYTYPNFWHAAMDAPAAIPAGMVGWWARYADTPRAPAVWGDPPPIWQCGDGQAGCGKVLAGVGPCDWNRMTDAAFAALFTPEAGEADDMFTDEDRARLATVHRLVTGAVGTGQADFAGTVEAILRNTQALINEGRAQTGTLATAIGKTDDTIAAAVVAALAANPATVTLSDIDRAAVASAVADQLAERGIRVDEGPLLDALAIRLTG